MKKPIVAGIVNFFLPGLGYLMIGRRVTFGWLVLISTIALWVYSFAYPMSLPPFELLSGSEALLSFIATFFLGYAFAYDAYQEAKHKR